MGDISMRGTSSFQSRKRKRMGLGKRPAAKRRRFPAQRQFVSSFLEGRELKYLDCAWNAVAIASSTDASGWVLPPSSGCTNAISVPAQGDTELTRDGLRYSIKNAFLTGTVDVTGLSDQADVVETSGYYFALVLDTQANGAVATSELVYTTPSTLALANLPQPLRNLQYSKRFKVLAQKYIQAPGLYAAQDQGGVGAGSLASTSTITNRFRPVLKMGWSGNIDVQCKSTTANVTSVVDNAIHVIACTGDTTFTPTFVGHSRIRFVG